MSAIITYERVLRNAAAVETARGHTVDDVGDTIVFFFLSPYKAGGRRVVPRETGRREVIIIIIIMTIISRAYDIFYTT